MELAMTEKGWKQDADIQCSALHFDVQQGKNECLCLVRSNLERYVVCVVAQLHLLTGDS